MITKTLKTLSGLGALLLPTSVFASVFDGGGVSTGLTYASNISGLFQGGPRDILIRVMTITIEFLGLLGTITIVVAGVMLIGGMGNDSSRDRAKNIIIYTSIGLCVIIFARAIIGFFIGLGSEI